MADDWSIMRGVRMIDQSFGVDHVNDQWPTESTSKKSSLGGLPEDDSFKTKLCGAQRDVPCAFSGPHA